MANQDIIGRAFQLRTHNQSVIDLIEPFTLNIPAGNLLSDDVGARFGYLVGSANLALTAAQSGSLIECGAAEDFTLPALDATTVGIWYEFVVTATATSLTITAGAGDILHGGVVIASTNAGLEADAFSANGTTDLVVTMNGTTQGGIIGSRIRFVAASATKWIVTGNLIGSGTIVTVFS